MSISPRTESRPRPNDPGEIGGPSADAQRLAIWRRQVEGARKLLGSSPPAKRDKPARPFIRPVRAPFNMLAPPSWRAILALVALRHGVSVPAILSRSRDRKVVAARHQAIALVATHCGPFSLPQIGRKFNRDHTTVLYAMKKCGVWGGADG